MFNRLRITQLVWILVAACCLVGAGLMQGLIDGRREEYELVPPGNVVAENYPGYALLTVAPGGLRAPIVNYLWIRAEAMKNEGRHYQAKQLADIICQLMPRFPGVWAFQSWNMAWNISVTTHTPQERWMWVNNGIELLRDKGIPMNPKALALYKELGWIFFSKMGQTTDEMHMVYKQQWASRMQRLLAAPPYDVTSNVIEAFKLIANAPLDKRPRRKGKDLIQADQLKLVLADEDVRRYAKKLNALGVKINESLLEAYNRFSHDDCIEITRVRPPIIKTENDRKLNALINDSNEKSQKARQTLLAFVRAQILWNRYKMDPAWMLHLMEKYEVPLDWRMVQAHGLYWVTYGIDLCKSTGRGNSDAMNIDRIVLNNLKSMTWNGRMTYTDNPRDADAPHVNFSSDWRYIEPAHQTHIAFAKALIEADNKEAAKGKQKTFDQNKFNDGHVNYLVAAIEMLYAAYRRNKADDYFTWIKENYPSKKGAVWEMPLDQFVIEMLNKDGSPIPSLARSQLEASTQAAFELLAGGNMEGYRNSISYAIRVYKLYQQGAPKRLKLPPFDIFLRNKLTWILVRPRAVGVNLDLTARHKIYAGLGRRMQVMLYDKIAQPLKKQCQQAHPQIDFNKAFPKPAGLEAYRQKQRQKFAPTE